MASYRVEVKPSAKKELERLSNPLIARITRRLETLASNPRPPGCKKLKGGGKQGSAAFGLFESVT